MDKGVGANVLGSPLLSLAYLVELLKRQPDGAAARRRRNHHHRRAYGRASGGRRREWHTEISGLPLAGLKIKFQ